MKKLSEMELEQGANAIGSLAIIFADVLENEKIEKCINDTLDWEGFTNTDKNGKTIPNMGVIIKSIVKGGAKTITRMIGVILKEKLNSAIEIVAIFTEKTENEIKKMNILEIAKILKDIFKDEELIKLFISVQEEKKSEQTELSSTCTNVTIEE